jgi:hypothetical protein
VQVHAWTVNDMAAVRKVLDAGVVRESTLVTSVHPKHIDHCWERDSEPGGLTRGGRPFKPLCVKIRARSVKSCVGRLAGRTGDQPPKGDPRDDRDAAQAVFKTSTHGRSRVIQSCAAGEHLCSWRACGGRLRRRCQGLGLGWGFNGFCKTHNISIADTPIYGPPHTRTALSRAGEQPMQLTQPCNYTVVHHYRYTHVHHFKYAHGVESTPFAPR